jgi:hypothetical protein
MLVGDVTITYIVRPHQVFERMGRDVGDMNEDALDRLADNMAGLYQEEARAVGADASGFFISQIAVAPAGHPGERMVRGAARYSGVIEEGWIWRAKGQESYPARWPAARAVDRADEAVQAAWSQVF